MNSMKCPVLNDARSAVHINTKNSTTSSEDFKLLLFPVPKNAYTLSSHLWHMDATPLNLESYVKKDHTEANHTEEFQCMLASENVLANEWDTPEEDEAWAHL